jgi:hypothetical protein
MGRNFTAVFNDGSTYLVEDVPDDTHPNDALAWTEKKFGRPVTEFIANSRSPLDEAKQVGKDTIRGVGKALSGGFEALVDTAPFVSWGYKPGEQFEAGKSPSQLVEKVIPTPKNDPKSRQMVRGVIEGASGGMVGPGAISAPLRTLAVGGGAGLGSELAGALTNDNPLAKGLGGLAGGVGTSLASMPKTTRGELARTTMEGVKDSDLAMAQKIMEEARKEGISLNLSQAMPTASNIDRLTEILANSPNGKEIVRQLRAQPAAVAAATEGGMYGLPGKTGSPQEIANRSQEGADKAVREGLAQASAAWQKAAPGGSTIPPTAVAELDARLKALAAKYPNTTGQDLIEDARRSLKLSPAGADTKVPVGSGKVSSNLTRTVQGKPTEYLNDALQLKSALDDSLNTYGSRKLNTPSLDSTNQRRAQEVRELFRDVLDTHAPKLSAANAAYSKVMDDVVTPMKQSVVGRVAGQRGYSPDQEAAQSKIFRVLDAGTAPGAATSEILTLEKSLRKSDPTIFQDAVKTWMSEKLAKATAKQGGRQSDSTAAALERAFIGDEMKDKGFQDMMVALARSQGLPDDSLLPGMRNLMKYVSAAARRPGKVGGITEQGLEDASRSQIAGAVGNFSMVQPFRAAGRRIDDALNADAYGFMDKLLTTPEGIATLRKLGKTPIMSRGMTDALTTFMATNASSNPED